MFPDRGNIATDKLLQVVDQALYAANLYHFTK